MKALFAVLVFLSTTGVAQAACYCGTVGSNPLGDKQIEDGRFNAWVMVDRRGNSPTLSLLVDGTTVCVKGTISLHSYHPVDEYEFDDSVTVYRTADACRGR